MSQDEPDEPEEPGQPEGQPGRPELPAAKPDALGVSARTQVVTVIGAVVVLLAAAVVFVLQGRGGDPGDPGPGGATTVPAPPSSGFEPSRDETLPPVPSVPAELCPTAPVAEPLVVLAFNIHYATSPAGRVDLAQIAEEITTWEADVVLLQEVDQGRDRTGGIAQAEALGQRTGLNWVYGGNQSSPGTGPIGNAILSRFPIVEWSNIHLPVAGGRERRGLLHAVLNVSGAQVSVYSTHLDHHASSARQAQATAILEILRADPRPTILGGDLNAPPGSTPVQVLRTLPLADAWAVGSGDGGTVPASNPRRRIDYLLHDGTFTPLQTAVLRSAVSDHRAVWTRIQFRQDIPCFQVGAG